MNIYFINWTASYEIRMIDYLSRHYPVSIISTPSLLNWLSKKFKKSKIIKKLLANLFIKKYLSKIKPDDVIIYNDSHVLKRFNWEIINKLKCKRVLLLRNPVSDSFIDDMKNCFDYVFGFENEVCNRHQIPFIPQFLPVGFKQRERCVKEKKFTFHPRCYFLGMDKGRYSTINELANNLKLFGCELNFYIVRDNTSVDASDFYINNGFTYDRNLLNVKNCDCIVDITQHGQSGWTLRVIEALYYNKKVITNNLSILNSEIYSSEKFFISGYDRWERFSDFLVSEIEQVNDDVLYKYSPDYMIEKVINYTRYHI